MILRRYAVIDGNLLPDDNGGLCMLSDVRALRMRTEHLLEDLDNLRHMLGVENHRPRKAWCYRNYYNANQGDPSMERLVATGLAEQYRPNYFRATEAGCRAIGLTEKEILKALNGD